jgi:iron complex outermembrane receptor protein
MKLQYRAVLIAMLASVSGQALAQAGVQPSSTPQGSGGDNAQQGATDPSITPAPSDEILVTAQRREQSLQDVTASVVAIGADRLQNQQINSLQDLQTVAPSVTFGNDFNQAKIFIRGVGANTSTTGNATGVALHVDGAVVSRAEAQLTSLFDLERVEVLRGPQGTLYGRNATGGSINLITAKPTSDFSGFARITYGNYNQMFTETAVSGPVTDQILFRIAAKMENRDGFGMNPITGNDVDDLNRWMARAHLQFDFSDSVDLLLTGEYFRQDDHSGAVHFLRESFPGLVRLASLGRGGWATNPRDLASEVDVGTDTETYSLTGTFRADLTDDLTLTNIANYRKFDSSLFQDLDLSGVLNSLQTTGQPTTVQERRIDSEQYSNELQFNYDAQFVDLVVGGFFFHERQRPIDNVGLSRRNGMQSNIPLLQAAGIDLAEAYELCGFGPGTVTGGSTQVAPKRVCTKSNLGTEAWAVFGQANIGLGFLGESLDGLTLKLGGRFSHEDVESANPSIVIAGGGRGPVLRATSDPSPIGVSTISAPTQGAGTYVTRSFEDFTPEIGLSYEPTPDLLLYYTYSEGFKAGSGENASGSRQIVDPETVQNHEAGIKATVFDGLSVNLAAYTYQLEGAQLNKTIAGGPTGYLTIFENAAESEAKGIELDVFGRLTPQLRVSGSVSYTDAQYNDFVTLDPLDPRNVAGGVANTTDPASSAFGAPCASPANDPATPTCEIQLSGNAVRNTPEWAWNVHAEYDILGLGDGTLTLQGDVSYKSRVYFTEFQREIESSAEYHMVDASAIYRTADDRLSFQVWAKNLFDIDRPASTFALATGRLIGVTYLPPRTFGATVGYNF